MSRIDQRSHSAAARGLALACLLVLIGVPALAGRAGYSRPGGSVRVHVGGGYHRGYGYRHRPYYHGHWRYGYYPYFGYAFWPGAWYGAPYYPVGGYLAAAPDVGAVSTQVSPKKADVLVDGEFVGQARDYTGKWNRLWLASGDHTIEFTREGYQTLRRHIEVRPGMIVNISEQLAQGEGIDPRSTEKPLRPPAVAESATPPAEAPPPSWEPPQGTLRHGLLRLEVRPTDAAVYLDGEFLANASELRRLHGAIPVAQGVHTIEVVRPGYTSRSEEVEIPGDEPVRMEIELERD